MSDLLWYLFKIQYVYICQNYKEISSMQMSSINNWYTSEGSCIIIYIYKKKYHRLLACVYRASDSRQRCAVGLFITPGRDKWTVVSEEWSVHIKGSDLISMVLIVLTTVHYINVPSGQGDLSEQGYEQHYLHMVWSA